MDNQDKKQTNKQTKQNKTKNKTKQTKNKQKQKQNTKNQTSLHIGNTGIPSFYHMDTKHVYKFWYHLRGSQLGAFWP